ncbi:hypothetical protein BH09PAT4_BH09PAT4_08850 [soil metagenome]
MNLPDSFKAYLEAQKKPASKITIKNYTADLNQFIRWYASNYNNQFHPSLMTPEVLEAFKKAHSENSAASSIERKLSTLRKFSQHLIDEGLITASPFASLAVPKPSDPWKLQEFKNQLINTKASDLTVKNYINDIKQFSEWSAKNTLSSDDISSSINTAALSEYREAMIKTSGLSDASINRKLSSLRRYVSFAEKNNIAKSSALVSNVSPINTKQSGETIAKPASDNLEQATTLPITQTAKHSESPTEHHKQKTYSKFPPLRLAQKIGLLITLGFDATVVAIAAVAVEKFHYISWLASGKQIFVSGAKSGLGLGVKLRELTSDLTQATTQSANGELPPLFNAAKATKELSRFHPTHPGFKFLPKHIQLWGHARHTRPNWYKKYHSYPVVHYFHFAALIIIMSAIGFGLYQSVVQNAQKNQTLAATPPNAPPRILSFQGRLTDSSDNPITSAKDLRFGIYSDPTSSGSALLWQETQRVTADQDGIFSVLLGSSTAIPASVFTNQTGLYLGITVQSDSELAPRQQIATVAFAANSETLQGLYPITAAGAGTSNVVLALDSSGNLTIGCSANPSFAATGGSFSLSGTTLNLNTTAGSNGNVSVTPDGRGLILLNKPVSNSSNNNNITTARGAVEIDDMLAVLATSSGQSAFTLEQDGAGPLFSASVSGAAKFSIANSGVITANNYSTGVAQFDVNGVLSSSALSLSGTNITGQLPTSKGGTGSDLSAATQGSVPYFSATGVMSALAPSTSGYVLTTQGAGANPTWTAASGLGTNYFQLNAGAISPANLSNDFLLGGSSTTSAKFAFINNASGTPTASIAGNLTLAAAGVIQTTLNQTLTIGGASTGNIIIQPTGANFIGIGTTTPTKLLDVQGGAGIVANFSGRVVGGNAVSSNEFVTLSQITGGTGQYWQRALGTLSPTNITDDVLIGGTSTASAKIKFGALANSDSFFNTGGNVGIGSTTPGKQLDVTGDIRASGGLFSSTAAGNPGGNGLFLNYSASTPNTGPAIRWSDGTLPNTIGLYVNAGLNFQGNSSNPDFRIRIPTGTGSLGTEIIHLGAASAASSSWFNGGNVGIGTTNPLGLLNATGSTTTTQGQALVNINQTGTASIFTASNSGVTRFDLAANGSIDQTSTTTTDYGYNLIANSLTSGTALNVNSTSTALTTGGLGVFDWSPASSTTSTGDLLSLNVGANGVLGNIFNVKNNGSSVFAVSQSQITANLPTSFTAPGDTSFAYDINLTNPTASYIKSAAPLYLQSGEIFNSSDLTLSTYNAGNVIIDSQALVANQSASISSQLVVGTNVAPANIGNFYLTNDTTYGKALAILNQTESSDILTGSVSGTTKFVFNSNGNLGIGTALPSQLLDVQGGSGSVANFSCRVAGGNAVSSNEFVTLSQITGGTGQYWQRALGALSPSNITDDVLIGGISTASAKIKFGALANSDSFFNTGGNLGIGTSNPNKQLEISAIKDATLRLSSTLNSSGWTPNTDTAGGVEFYTNDASGGGPNVVGFMKSVTTATAGNLWDLAFGTSSNNAVASEVLRITGGGNVGIGSTAPAFALDVNGNINTSSTYKIGGTDVLSATTLGSGVINSSLTSVGTLTTGTWNASIIGALYGGTGANLSAATQGSVPYFGSTGVMAALAPGTAGFVLSTNGVGANPTWVAASGLGTNYWQRNLGVLSPLNITDDLAIGGTATASSTFQVFGKAYTNNFQTVPSGTASLSGNLVFDSASAQNIDILKGSALNFRTSAGGDAGLATRLTLTSNGNLGIGTTAPRARLENSSQSILGFVSGSTNGIQSGQSILFYNSSAVNWAGLQVDTGGSLLVNTGTSNRFMPLYMTVAGNIGVGTNSASQRLDIFAGNERFSQLPVPAAPLVALAGLGAGNLSNGNYLYRVTFVTAAGETSLSAASATVTVVDNSTDGQVSITGIPTGLPGLVTSRKIYRTTVGGATYRLLTTLANNTTTTFTDNVPDTDLGLQATNLNTTAGDFFVGANRAFHLDTSGNIGIGGGAQAQLPTQKLYLTTGNNIAAEMATIATAINAAPYNDPNVTLTAGTYYFKVAPLDGSGGVGLISTTEASCTVDGVTTNACAVNWSAVQGAVQYRLYKGTTTQAEDRFVPTLGNSTTVNYTSDAVATLGLPPVTVGAYAFKFSSAGASYFNGGNLGIGTGAPTALLQINAPKVASTAAATGTVGTTTLNVTGTAGGDTFISTTGTGGAGSALTLVGGVGGTASAALTSSIGGAGGAVNFTGGVGGLANIFGTGNNTGGAGGAFTWAGGAGGAATGSTSGNNLSGAGAAISLIAGTSGVANSLNDTAGNITTGNGGALTINSGTAGLSSYTGTGTVGNIIGGNGGTYTQTAGTGGAASITNIGAGAAVTGGNGAAYNITSGTGGAASLTGGGSATTVTGGTAGTLSISGGTGGAASLTNGTATGNVAGGNGGAVTISGGTGGAGITTGGTGGTLTLNGGLSSTSQNASGGAVAISGRSSSATGTGGAGGAVTIAAGSAAGDNTVARPGGLISLAAGASKGPGQAGGAITFASGAGGSNINTGTATGPNSGGISLTIATAGSATLADVLSTGGNGGTYTISGGAGGAASVAGTGANTGGSGSTFTWQAGSGGAANGVTSATNTGGAGGAVSLISGTGGAATAGSGSLVGGTGGVLTLRAGTGGAGTTGGNGGATTIQGGTAATTGPGVGGALTLVGGIGGSTGSGGSIIFNTSAVNSSATRMTITNAGNVGIGSTLPGGLFAIRSSVAATPIATFSAGISPTVDMVSITNGSFPITTAGVNALSINYTGGNAAVESGAVRLDLKPGGLTGGTWDGYRIVANATGPVTGVTENLVKI